VLKSAYVAALALVAVPANAQNQRLLDSLQKVEPNTRLEQICDFEAMRRIRRDTGKKVDRAKSDASSTPVHDGHTLTVNGGAFRAGGKWFQLSFVCKGSPDHLHVTEFTYKVGEEIPESKWSSLGLWR
jgi:hypothetical protein